MRTLTTATVQTSMHEIDNFEKVHTSNTLTRRVR